MRNGTRNGMSPGSDRNRDKGPGYLSLPTLLTTAPSSRGVPVPGVTVVIVSGDCDGGGGRQVMGWEVERGKDEDKNLGRSGGICRMERSWKATHTPPDTCPT
jgi:hypothetical protein